MTIWEYGALAIALWAGMIGTVVGATGMWIWTRQPAKPIRRYRRALLRAEIQIRSRRLADTLLGRNRPHRDRPPSTIGRIMKELLEEAKRKPGCKPHREGYICSRTGPHDVHVALAEYDDGDLFPAAVWDSIGDLVPISTRWQEAVQTTLDQTTKEYA